MIAVLACLKFWRRQSRPTDALSFLLTDIPYGCQSNFKPTVQIMNQQESNQASDEKRRQLTNGNLNGEQGDSQ
ncbi:hypothetical protein TW79_20365 [Tritonibacter mobilis]|nr:hypothetical protein TW79_20365 [Tritonibacter mobilis]